MEENKPLRYPVSVSATARGRRRRAGSIPDQVQRRQHGGLEVDPYRNIVFPNRIREQRLKAGFFKLFGLASQIPNLPYIRLSKLERGEVFARPEELQRVGAALGIDPRDLLLDVEDRSFDISSWAEPFGEGAIADSIEELQMASLLAAAVRAKRMADERLTAATMATDYGIPPVILSRLENALKGLGRWNSETTKSLCRLFGVNDLTELKVLLNAQHKSGFLGPFLAELPTAASRQARTRQRVSVLREALDRRPTSEDQPGQSGGDPDPAQRKLSVFGSPLADGLIAMTPAGVEIDAPSYAGARAFALRIGRATLGGGLPGQATVIVDPDRFPQPGGLALVKEPDGYRIFAVAIGKDGRMTGYSTCPAKEALLDDFATGSVAAIVAAIFV